MMHVSSKMKFLGSHRTRFIVTRKGFFCSCASVFSFSRSVYWPSLHRSMIFGIRVDRRQLVDRRLDVDRPAFLFSLPFPRRKKSSFSAIFSRLFVFFFSVYSFFFLAFLKKKKTRKPSFSSVDRSNLTYSTKNRIVL